jgi:mRNA interferase MazF
VLLLSRDRAYVVRDLIVVTPLTTRVRGIRAEVRLGPEDGLPRPSVANLDVITTVPKGGLKRRITTLSAAKLQAVDVAIRFALGLET